MTMNRKTGNARLTDDRIARDAAIREKYQAAKPTPQELEATGEFSEAVAQRQVFDMLELMAKLKALRTKRGLSLTDVAQRSGIDKAALSRLENGHMTNPTLGTIETYAHAVQARLRLEVEETDPDEKRLVATD